MNNILKYKFEEKYIDEIIQERINIYNLKTKEEKKKIDIQFELYVRPFDIERLPNFKRSDTYKLNDKTLNLIFDVNDNNFEPLVKQILESKQSYHINGRAGTGKSTLIKLLQGKMK